jgi:pimeloyl-ACP methyl ester carboxylesterase
MADHAAAQAGRTALAYERHGKGVPVVLIHAFPLSRQMWQDQRNLAERFEIIAVDLPGFGESPRQASPSIPDMASAVLRLLDQIKVQRAAIAGLSMGGYVTLEVLRQAPNRVLALGLCSTRATPDTPEQRAGRAKTAQEVRQQGLEPFIAAMVPKLLGKSTPSRQPQLADRVREIIRRNQPDGVADALQAMGTRADSTPLLAGIQCPTLIVAGDEDVVIPPAAAEAMRAAVPNATFTLIQGAGHLVNLEQPAAFSDAFRTFLQQRISS